MIVIIKSSSEAEPPLRARRHGASAPATASPHSSTALRGAVTKSRWEPSAARILSPRRHLRLGNIDMVLKSEDGVGK